MTKVIVVPSLCKFPLCIVIRMIQDTIGELAFNESRWKRVVSMFIYLSGHMSDVSSVGWWVPVQAESASCR